MSRTDQRLSNIPPAVLLVIQISLLRYTPVESLNRIDIPVPNGIFLARYAFQSSAEVTMARESENYWGGVTSSMDRLYIAVTLLCLDVLHLTLVLLP